jgi:hypothetical protein
MLSLPVVNVEVKGQKTTRTVKFSDGQQAVISEEPTDDQEED